MKTMFQVGLDGSVPRAARKAVSYPPERSASPTFDRQSLVNRLMGDEALVKEIVAGFLADMPIQIRALRAHIGAGDAKSAGIQAHTIKGAAAGVGGMALSAVAFQMEQVGKAGRLDDIAALMPELDRQLERLKEAMEKSCAF